MDSSISYYGTSFSISFSNKLDGWILYDVTNQRIVQNGSNPKGVFNTIGDAEKYASDYAYGLTKEK